MCTEQLFWARHRRAVRVTQGGAEELDGGTSVPTPHSSAAPAWITQQTLTINAYSPPGTILDTGIPQNQSFPPCSNGGSQQRLIPKET